MCHLRCLCVPERRSQRDLLQYDCMVVWSSGQISTGIVVITLSNRYHLTFSSIHPLSECVRCHVRWPWRLEVLSLRLEVAVETPLQSWNYTISWLGQHSGQNEQWHYQPSAGDVPEAYSKWEPCKPVPGNQEWRVVWNSTYKNSN